jgi:hypothetical protein
MKFRQYLIAIVLLLPALCIAGSIYEDARQQAITLFDKCDYRTAAKQFIAVQDIAPVVNDLSSWIIKCNKQIAIQNNKVRPTRTSSKKTTSNATTQVEVVDDGFVVYDSIGHYNDGGIDLARLNGKYGWEAGHRLTPIREIGKEQQCLFKETGNGDLRIVMAKKLFLANMTL